MKWWNRLSFRLTGVILLLAIVPLAGFGITTIRDIRQVRLNSIAQIQEGVAVNSVKLIEASLAHMIENINLAIETAEMDSADASDQEWYLQLLIRNLPSVHSLAIIAEDGREKVKVGVDVVYSASDLKRFPDYFNFRQRAAPSAVIGDIHSIGNNLLILDVLIPILSPMDRHAVSVVVVEVNLEKLLGFTADLRVGKTGYVYVVNHQGKILVYPDHSVVLAGANALANPVVQAFMLGKNEGVSNGRYINRQGVDVLTNGCAISDPKLLVVVVQSVDEALAAVSRIGKRQAILLVFVLVIAIFFSLYFVIRTITPLRRLEVGARRIGEGHLGHRIPVTSSDELGVVAHSFNAMAMELESVHTRVNNQNWLKQGMTELDNLLRGEQSLKDISTRVLNFMASYLQEQVGLIYVHDGTDSFRYMAGYAFKPGPGFSEDFKPGEGLSGQAALEKKVLDITDIPGSDLTVTSGLGSKVPRHLSIVPFVFNGRVEAVMELGSLHEVSELKKQFLRETADSIAIIFASARSRQNLEVALAQTREQAQTLQYQQQALQSANEEMEEQTQMLMASESKLKEQQEELQAANEELEEKAHYLEHNKKSIEEKNTALEALRRDLEKKASDLAVTSKYKSEFLANMSHELRTPLNSLLLLSRLLSDNKEGNLLQEQVDSARIIYNSGNDLLCLINEILDLSKIEAGKMDLHLTQILVADLATTLEKNFKPLAQEKGLFLNVLVRQGTPEVIENDRQRIEQVIKNFISNAIKFTTMGGVTVEIYQPGGDVVFNRSDLTPHTTIAIDVKDTGIGIPGDKQKLVFEAFQQLESGTARKYGGTGLGLSISRELAHLLGGEIQLCSQENKGSTFTLFLPAAPPSSCPSPVGLMEEIGNIGKKTDGGDPAVVADKNPEASWSHPPEDEVLKGRNILIVDDDMRNVFALAKVLQEKGINTIKAENGLKALEILARNEPVDMVLMDIMMPVMDGYETMRKIREQTRLSKLPIIALTAKAMQQDRQDCISAGANDYLTKPVDIERLLSMVRVWLHL